VAATQRITRFRPAGEPVTAPVTKFGGQPTWLGDPAWPVSQGWDRPMRFVCQIALDTGGLAYVFVTHADHDDPDFFDPDVIFPDGGENAVIIQPDGHYDGPVSQSAVGPTLFLEDGSPAEFVVELEHADEPDFLPQKQYVGLSAEEQSHYYDAVSGNKIGGAPAFFQGDDWPDDDPWQLLSQLDTGELPFYLNLGASPVVFTFISPDGRRGRFLVQDS
jgi:uncharacterized protein YwqG